MNPLERLDKTINHIDELLIELGKSNDPKAKETVNYINTELEEIYNRYASQIHFDSGSDTTNSHAYKLKNLGYQLLSSRREIDVEYGVIVLNKLRKILGNI
ncbi:hypothetical protein NSQ85_00905 [Streptococcus sp. FSL L8-0526]|uniref:hypothetical protein n=1 Tax=Streptococcus sp. FSL L8-0526 TaxID=2954690 RepID=UPI0030F878F2